MFCLTNFEELSFVDQISDLNALLQKEPVKILELLQENFDISTFIPDSFYNSFYSDLGRDRRFSLESVLSALIIMHLFRIPSTYLLWVFLTFSHDIRYFCRLSDRVPDEPFFSRFKSSFEVQIAELFNNMALKVNDICKEIDEALPSDSPDKGLSSLLIYDTSGAKPAVKENNPKTLVSEINKQKSFARICNNPDFNPYAAAYKNMPKQSSVNPSIKLDFVNGHFGYFYKFGMITNGFGIPLRLHFFDSDFYSSLNSDFDSPEDQKYEFDNASLLPVVKPFLDSLPLNNFTSFLGDSEFDSYDNFSFLKSSGFEKVFIPINPRNTKDSIKSYDLDGTPICPVDKSPFIPDGSCRGENRSFRYKFVCPKSIRVKGKWTTTCENPCRETNSTVTNYIYPHQDFRLYPGVLRSSDEWDKTYKIRASIEREFASMKNNSLVSSPKTFKLETIRSDIFLCAISKLVVVILAHALNNPQYLRNLSQLVKHAA